MEAQQSGTCLKSKQDQGWTLPEKAVTSSIPIEQMGKSRLLPGGVPAPAPFLPQVVSWDRWILSPSQGLLSPWQVRKLLYEAPRCAGPAVKGPREGRVCLWLRVFSLQTRPSPKCFILCVWWGCHVPRLLPTATRPWGWATPGPPRPRHLWKEDCSSGDPLITPARPGQAQEDVDAPSQGDDSLTSWARCP